MRRAFSLVTALLGLLMAVSLSRADVLPFQQAEFDKALKSGKPVVVDFYADWCAVCKMQKTVTHALLSEPGMKGITMFVANFDTEKSLKQSLKVTAQSTMVVFKDGKEVARSMGQTRREQLAALFSKAL